MSRVCFWPLLTTSRRTFDMFYRLLLSLGLLAVSAFAAPTHLAKRKSRLDCVQFMYGGESESKPVKDVLILQVPSRLSGQTDGFISSPITHSTMKTRSPQHSTRRASASTQTASCPIAGRVDRPSNLRLRCARGPIGMATTASEDLLGVPIPSRSPPSSLAGRIACR